MVMFPVLSARILTKSAAIIQNVAIYVVSCAPCAEDCSWTCPHRGRYPLPCAAPCDIPPCSESYKAILICGYQCPSMCGGVCPGTTYCQIYVHPAIMGLVVDFILLSAFEEVELSENPCIVLPCGHVLTLESMDGHMSMPDFYTLNGEGLIVGLKNAAEPYSPSRINSCLRCRRPLRNLNRYSRIIRRALTDEPIKKVYYLG